MEDLSLAGFKMRFVPFPSSLEHRLRSVYGGEMAGGKAVADEADHVAVAAADLEDLFVGADVEQFGRPSVAFRDIAGHG